MRLVIAPAKTMVRDGDTLPWAALPEFVERAERLRDWMRGLEYGQLKKLWACSDAIARQNAERLEHMDLRTGLTPALIAYEGIQYTSMAPAVFDGGQLAYVQEHLRILSGFYGVLRPMDGVVPYRLEMQAKAQVDGYADLYGFWGDALYGAVLDESRVLVNLASKEYSKAIERYVRPGDMFITCMFGELEDGPGGERVVQKGVFAKMARGHMVRYLASIGAETPDDLLGFQDLGYQFDESRSDAATYVFTRRGSGEPRV